MTIHVHLSLNQRLGKFKMNEKKSVRDAKSPAEGRGHFLRALETQDCSSSSRLLGRNVGLRQEQAGNAESSTMSLEPWCRRGGLDPPKAAGG